MPSSAQPLGEASDRLAVAETLTLVFHHTDARAWRTLRTLFAADARIDYTALNDGEPQTAPEVIDGWEVFMPGFDRTQHLLGPVVVTLSGDTAQAEAHGRARHEIDGEPVWVIGGHYATEFIRDIEAPRGWRITSFSLLVPYVEGNTDLPALAGERASGAADE